MGKKFGTIKGVFIPSTEAILGTVLFLLVPVLTADVGLIAMLAIIIVAHTVTLATSFSIADCATNLNSIGGGGMYALSKRSLGHAFGGSIGIQLYIAQAASIGFYCIGFAEPLQPILSGFFQSVPFLQGAGTGDILFQKQALATVMLIVFFFIVIVGADFTLKIQGLIMVILVISVGVIFFSPFMNEDVVIKGLFSSSEEPINLWGNRAVTIPVFFLTFTQFFPAVTGIDAGVGMSGDLENPKESLVKGTFYAIAVTFTVYIIAAVVFSFMSRGMVISGYSGNNPTGKLLTDLLGFQKQFPWNILGVMVLLGILFATSSSALSCFMTAPRTAQSLSRDGLLPNILHFIGKDFFRGGREPRFAAVVTFFIALAIIWAGNINMAAMIVGICFLVVYGWVNGSAFFERISQNPTFRPTSRGHWAISLYGYLASMAAIMLFNWIVGVAVIIVQYSLFRLLLKYRAMGKLEGVWWGVLFSFITRGLYALGNLVQGSKNWRPILIALSVPSKVNDPEKISYIADLISSYKGLVNVNILTKDDSPEVCFDVGAYSVCPSVVKTSDITEAILTIIQANNTMNIAPNTVLMDYSKNIDVTKIIKRILSLEKDMLLLKNGEKLGRPLNIDLWWRGEKNGNLMIMIAYIIRSSLGGDENRNFHLRVIRKLDAQDSAESARAEMNNLMTKARLSGEVVLLPFSDMEFTESVYRTSAEKADLLLMGLPGNYAEKETRKLFNLDEYFFRKDINKYDDLPAILFVRSSHVIDLIED